MNFLEWKVFVLIQVSLNFKVCNYQKVNIFAANGLAENMWQAITWSNSDQDQWHNMTSLNHNELILCDLMTHIGIWLRWWLDDVPIANLDILPKFYSFMFTIILFIKLS